jgi:glucose-1-phosphate cytidylyltransferase
MIPKLVILAGGRGTRLNEKTKDIPKPLIKLGDSRPIIWHIMNWYSKHGFNEFVVCLGYKGNLISNYFDDNPQINWKIKFVDTGLEDGTASRISQVKSHLGNTFFVTYGDGLSDVNIRDLLNFHLEHKRLATVTAVRPLVRFGLLKLENHNVTSFNKYSKPPEGWIDGGFFVFQKKIFERFKIKNKKDMLEGAVLENLAQDEEFCAFKHEGYWHCIDTYRDLKMVNKDITNKEGLWNESL